MGHNRDEDIWELWRQDDAGNRYLMLANLSEDEARRLQAKYEARGHKQMYWIERRERVARPRPTGHADEDQVP